MILMPYPRIQASIAGDPLHLQLCWIIEFRARCRGHGAVQVASEEFVWILGLAVIMCLALLSIMPAQEPERQSAQDLTPSARLLSLGHCQPIWWLSAAQAVR